MVRVRIPGGALREGKWKMSESLAAAWLITLLCIDGLGTAALAGVFVYEVLREKRQSAEEWAPIAVAAICWMFFLLITWAVGTQLWKHV